MSSFAKLFLARRKRLALVTALGWTLGSSLPACELCAIYSADTANGDSGKGFLLTLAQQYVSAHVLQANGNVFSTVPFLSSAYVDTSTTHLVPTYNFSKRFGVSLNLPVVVRSFRRTEIPTTGGANIDERGTIAGVGDAALVARVNLIQKVKMSYAINMSLLAGVKFPTGDASRIDSEVDAAKTDRAIFGPNHPHGNIGGVHQHDLSPGSGSFDGVFGLTTSLRWQRWFFNNQIQYYLRTEGHSYKFGDLLIISGGPGAYLLLNDHYTLSLQANTFYEHTARDQIIGQTFEQTGMSAWYLGPLLNLTVGEHFSANAGVDIPLSIANNGLQTVPDYRLRGSFSWRF